MINALFQNNAPEWIDKYTSFSPVSCQVFCTMYTAKYILLGARKKVFLIKLGVIESIPIHACHHTYIIFLDLNNFLLS
jgi:hypothetical protein